ncbi:tetratricopeptide repeat protein [Actinosynnema mirum]|uniref:TPR repeat-containing protein n=1 Tax=Actinosynnema mirum (strain ATCC 29888 / DSM 43827 / JCM 3225 / NBRC 14064 / NCIMB 13271 / NRRL B-12336 / IMRU 3971 / 101) TaxID=446462 RepID=C6WP28_ACTMD|nr:tetratricopeptide repeat protein [Actinosynnema mirum]ACU36697.1 TPR repeat-containing protein [Actinosynnema mirum DSM 43827]
MTARHLWVRADRAADRAAHVAALDLPPLLARVDAHRNLRGPYSAAGALLRALAPDVLADHPDLAARHNIEVATVAPELAALVPSPWSSMEWTVSTEERTRFYSRLHTLNIANGLADLLRATLTAPATLVVDNAHHADPTDQEFVAVLLRRTDLPNLHVVVCTATTPLEDPKGELSLSLKEVLPAHATPLTAPALPDPPYRSYVDSDGAEDDPRSLADYHALPPAERAALHDARRAELAARSEKSLELGAIPFHAERGSDQERRTATLLTAMDHCRKVGLYQAAVDFGVRGRAAVDRESDPKLWWHFTEGASTAMASVGRAEEAEEIYHEARAASADPVVHMNLAYGSAMLYARHFPAERRDFQRARGWMNLSIALADQLGDPKERAFHSVFSRNGLALVEVRQGRPAEALRLLEEGMARLDADLAPGEHPLHRSVLRYNRAQVNAMTGKVEEALADYQAVAALDPDFPEHHFHVASMLRKLGRDEEALEAFERVLPLSPPFPEVHYNLGDTRLALGDAEGALAEFTKVLELDPAHQEARLSRAELRCDLGDHAGALADVEAGLALSPDNPMLRCVQATALADAGAPDQARTLIESLTTTHPTCAQAWAIRARLEYESGELPQALADFDESVRLLDAPEVRYNRALVLEETGDYTRAAQDYREVLARTEDEDARDRLAHCLSLT